jgi:hypothetical protein
MSGTAPPRGFLARRPAAKSGGPALTDSLIEFLRAELRTYKATVRKRGRKLSDDRLAQEIQFCPAIDPPVEFGQETLRRFLKDIPQEHGDEFFRAIATFLLHEKWITQADIDGHDQDVNLRAAVAMQFFFGAQPQEDPPAFYRSISGVYMQYACIPGRIVEVTLVISIHKKPPILRIQEQEDHFRTVASEFIMRETDGLNMAKHARIAMLLKSHAQRVGTSRRSSGFGVADDKIVSFFLRSELTGDATAYLVDAIQSFEDGASIDRFRSSRYVGWTMAAENLRAAADSTPSILMQRIPE